MKIRKIQDTFKIKGQVTAGTVVWRILKIFIYLLMVFFALTFILSFVWIFLNSFKTAIGYQADSFGLPKKWNFGNYRTVWENLSYKGNNLFQMVGNSLILIVINVINCMIWPQFAGYALARFQFPGRKFIESMVYVAMIIPVIGTASSVMQIKTALGLYDTFLGEFLFSSVGLGFTQILLMLFYRGLPAAYAEAAYIDGAGEWRVFLSIYYPQSLPLLLIQLIQTGIAVWNDYMNAYLMLPTHPTLALGLQQMQAQFVDYGNDYPVMFAGVVMSMIPILILYLIFSQKIMGNTAVGALK